MTDGRSTVDALLPDIWDEMHRRRYTQKTFAALIGVSQTHLSQVFNGHVRLTVPMLRRMLAALDMELVIVQRGSGDE